MEKRKTWRVRSIGADVVGALQEGVIARQEPFGTRNAQYTHAHTLMLPFRTIRLERSAYERLAAAKREGETFSDVVNPLTRDREPSLLDLAGVLNDETARELRRVFHEHREEQHNVKEERWLRFGWVA